MTETAVKTKLKAFCVDILAHLDSDTMDWNDVEEAIKTCLYEVMKDYPGQDFIVDCTGELKAEGHVVGRLEHAPLESEEGSDWTYGRITLIPIPSVDFSNLLVLGLWEAVLSGIATYIEKYDGSVLMSAVTGKAFYALKGEDERHYLPTPGLYAISAPTELTIPDMEAYQFCVDLVMSWNTTSWASVNRYIWEHTQRALSSYGHGGKALTADHDKLNGEEGFGGDWYWGRLKTTYDIPTGTKLNKGLIDVIYNGFYSGLNAWNEDFPEKPVFSNGPRPIIYHKDQHGTLMPLPPPTTLYVEK